MIGRRAACCLPFEMIGRRAARRCGAARRGLFGSLLQGVNGETDVHKGVRQVASNGGFFPVKQIANFGHNVLQTGGQVGNGPFGFCFHGGILLSNDRAALFEMFRRRYVVICY
jgi:hypothetical protein